MRTRVGYAGGGKTNPNYYDLGDHSETIELDYDPAFISFEDLLDIFWSRHDPTSGGRSTQYKSILFFHDEEQERIAGESKARLESLLRRPVLTEVRRLDRFYLAEDFHQKYRLQNTPEFMTEFRAIYPVFANLVASTAAARVNGYLWGFGKPATLVTELDDLGLSAAVGKRLRLMVAPRPQK